ncbi:unnamed protein product [Agarophyton chilense]
MSARTKVAPDLPVAPAKSAADQVLESLLAANAAFVNGEPASPATVSPTVRAHLATNGQAPGAIIISCADSRVSPEIIFRAGLGDLFVIRNAGNVTWDESVSASVEFAVQVLKSSVVIVLGHSNCGAVAAATAVARGNPMQQTSLGRHVHRISDGVKNFCHDERAAVEQNVRNGVDQLRHNHVVQSAVASSTIRLVGAVYDLATGRVQLLDH